MGVGLAWPPPVYWAAVAVLLIVIAGELFFSTRQESQTFDESSHLFAGYEYWKHGDFGRNPEHPPLAKLIAALPLLRLPVEEPATIPIPFFKVQDFINGAQFLYQATPGSQPSAANGAKADALLVRGRAMIAIFSLVLAVVIFLAGREMFGSDVGLLGLVLLAFEPTFLANGALITTDVPLACLMFLAVYTFYRFVKRPTLVRLAVCGLCAALAMVTKHSGALVLPILLLLAVAELLLRPAAAANGTVATEAAARPFFRSRAATLAGGLIVIAIVCYGVLWAFYGFRFAARPGALQIAPTLAAYSNFLTSPAQKAIIGFCGRHHLFPEAYLYGWVDILQISSQRSTFVFGKLYSSGRWEFFPAMFVIKSTLTLLVLLLLAPFARMWGRRREVIFLAVPAAAFLLVAIISRLNMGVRHIFPIYPFCIVLAAATAWQLARRSRPWAIAMAVLVLFAVVSSLHAFPDYLTYSNEAFGGPSNTYRVVTDSNADWGQGLKWAKRYLDDNKVSDCWFDYSIFFVDPRYYGIDCKPLPSAFVMFGMSAPVSTPPRISGTIMLSPTEVEGLLWGPDVLNPYAQFQHLKPDAQPGNEVLIYHGTFDVPLAAAYSDAATAVTLLRYRKIPEALAEAQAAARLAPEDAQVQLILGQALMAAGRAPEGQQAMALALHLAKTIHPEYQERVIETMSEVVQ